MLFLWSSQQLYKLLPVPLKEEDEKALRHLSHYYQKDEETLKKWLSKLPDALKRLAGKTAEILLVIVEVSLILFLVSLAKLMELLLNIYGI